MRYPGSILTRSMRWPRRGDVSDECFTGERWQWERRGARVGYLEIEWGIVCDAYPIMVCTDWRTSRILVPPASAAAFLNHG